MHLFHKWVSQGTETHGKWSYEVTTQTWVCSKCNRKKMRVVNRQKKARKGRKIRNSGGWGW